jgi:cysteate synthase
MNFEPTKYILQNVATGNRFEDTGWLLEDAEAVHPSLIRALYEKKHLQPKGDDYGLYTFADWLPVIRSLKGSSAPITYKSEKLAAYLGCKNLYITFSGYWLEKNALMTTCSFKETEAYSVCARMRGDMKQVLVVASAGNTARAFAKVCSENNIPLLLCVPEDNLDALWFEHPVNECVKLVSAQSGGDYFDAIHLSNIAVKSPKFLAEGGAKNVARRDGMGTTVLSAATFIGKIPDYYFQSVGSGTGAIAAWEANQRLIADGRFGNNLMQLFVSQNIPFTPMYDAWKVDSRQLLPFDDDEARQQVQIIDAKVLSNRKPPYAIVGGLYDALKASNGDVLLSDNQQLRAAMQLFLELEGNDIHPAAGVALASLIHAVKTKMIDKNAVIMLNITGGGEQRFKAGKKLHYLKPNIIFPTNPDENEVLEALEGLF